ncbi:MAG: ATP synthase F0 subunit B [Bdellovibrionales bacterium]|nr:ATP synthase F0 subunit B [Bdellovibrionales bacterium]
MEQLLKTFDLTTLDALMILSSCVLFFILWSFLDRFVFSPYLKLIEARESVTTGAKQEAAEMAKRAGNLDRQYEELMTAERVRLMEVKLAALSQAKLEGAQILKSAESEAQRLTLEARESLEKLYTSIKADVPKQAEDLADEISQKILSQARQPSLIGGGN